jgi:hypothetical protein
MTVKRTTKLHSSRQGNSTRTMMDSYMWIPRRKLKMKLIMEEVVTEEEDTTEVIIRAEVKEELIRVDLTMGTEEAEEREEERERAIGKGIRLM